MVRVISITIMLRSVDLKVAVQQALFTESDLCQHGPARRILRAYGGLHAMQYDRAETVAQALRHTLVSTPSPVAELDTH